MNNELEELKPDDGLVVHTFNPQDNPNTLTFVGSVGITPEMRQQMAESMAAFGRAAKTLFDGFKDGMRRAYPELLECEWRYKYCCRIIKKGPRKGTRVYSAIKIKDTDHE